MAEFEVTISGLKSAVGTENSIINKLSAACRDIDACRNALSTSVSIGYAAVKRNLNVLEEQVLTSSNKISSMATALCDIYGAYHAAEMAILGKQVEGNAAPIAVNWAGMSKTPGSLAIAGSWTLAVGVAALVLAAAPIWAGIIVGGLVAYGVGNVVPFAWRITITIWIH